jgi:hypothetical protein
MPHLAATSGDQLSIYLGKGDGTFTMGPGSPLTTGSSSQLAVGDFNGDGKLDLALAPYGENNDLGILLGKGNGSFQPAITTPSHSIHPHFLSTPATSMGTELPMYFFAPRPTKQR